jgi:hypothetical protein
VLPCASLESADFFALLSFSFASTHATWASFFSSIEDESDCLVEVEDRDSWRGESGRAVETGVGLASRRLGRLKVILWTVVLEG